MRKSLLTDQLASNEVTCDPNAIPSKLTFTSIRTLFAKIETVFLFTLFSYRSLSKKLSYCFRHNRHHKSNRFHQNNNHAPVNNSSNNTSRHHQRQRRGEGSGGTRSGSREGDEKTRFWNFLMDNLDRAVDAIYSVCDQNESVQQATVRSDEFLPSFDMLKCKNYRISSSIRTLLKTSIIWRSF